MTAAKGGAAYAGGIVYYFAMSDLEAIVEHPSDGMMDDGLRVADDGGVLVFTTDHERGFLDRGEVGSLVAVLNSWLQRNRPHVGSKEPDEFARGIIVKG